MENEPKLFESMPPREPGTTTTNKVMSMSRSSEVKRKLKEEEKTAKQMINMMRVVKAKKTKRGIK